ncbi:MAG: ABC transporter substrate-binding protein [Hyphomicrobium sp.]|nr:ABC transporter substrate-binding protein [Hyphomicrobium sp.]
MSGPKSSRRGRGAAGRPDVMISRRLVVGSALALGAGLAFGIGGLSGDARAAAGKIRVASVKFGSLAWLLETIRAEGLDQKHGITIEVVETATNQSSPIALYGGTADVVVTDWPWGLRQRAMGEPVRFAPFSASLGSVMVPDASPVKSLKDLEGKRLGVAGSSSDKSWLILRAYTRQKLGFDVGTIATPQFGAAPLLNEQLRDGQLDAILNFWTFAARLEAQGFRRVISMADVLTDLGITPQPALVGFTWKASDEANLKPQLDGILAAAADANKILVESDQPWDRLKGLMKANDPKEFELLKAGYRSGVRGAWSSADMASAEKIMTILLESGDTDLAKNGTRFDPDLFYTAGA